MKTQSILRFIASIVASALISTQCGFGTAYALRQETAEAGAGGIGRELGVTAKAGAIGRLSVTLPKGIRQQVAVAVEELRKTLPIVMIHKWNFSVVDYGEGPFRYYDEGFSFKWINSFERQQVFYEDLAYIGTDVRMQAVNKKVLILANSKEEAEAKKVEIAALEGIGLKSDNIRTAASIEEVRIAIAEVGKGGFDFIVRVGTISYESQFQSLSLPKVSMEYDSDQFKLRKRLEDATLASSV